ncbi:MAG TPA: lysophospholipid acyltransferase family protein [Verrucomicrobiae bacterium]|nr:lysophospholipid acyltransferase family protein [Verrucomicrobiae bacterium]
MWRACFFLLFFIPFTLLHSLVAVIGGLFNRSGAFGHRCALSWSRGSLRVARVRVTVSGTEHVPAAGPVVYMGNHQGNFDILALTTAIPRRFSWLAKEELFRIPVFGPAMRRAGYIPLDRSDGRRALKSIDAAAAAIRSGISVVVFPEGTRSHDGSLLPFKKGAFLLAAKAGVPVVPFTINGSRRINPRNRLELNPGDIRIAFAPPLDPRVLGREEMQERVRRSIEEGLQA